MDQETGSPPISMAEALAEIRAAAAAYPDGTLAAAVADGLTAAVTGGLVEGHRSPAGVVWRLTPAGEDAARRQVLR